ncbi:MAG: DNA replication/repair protein RecF [Methylococcaceae bacterium]|nr:DNA replication/repair protein RecF [Methylococcaceae bacterium]
MSLTKLDVFDVRNIERAALTPSSRLNFIVGANGSGKTSLLEAIYILGRARSFRSSQAGQVIRFQQECLTVSGRSVADEGPAETLGVRLARRQREIMLTGRKLQSSAELIAALPVLLIQPASSGLLENPPKGRRQFLDWGAFHLEPGYLDQWRGYARALNQRNALLRQGAGRQAEQTWNHELARYGTMVALARERYGERLAPYFLEASRHFLGTTQFELKLTAGWDRSRDLLEVLGDDRDLDRRLGYTHSGAHKGDFAVLADGRPAKAYLSRGQMKLLVFALLLSQAHLLEQSLNRRGCVLVDDLASELDGANRDKLLAYLAERRSQFFITATDDSLLPVSQLPGSGLFRMDQGRVTAA